jgi:type I restriction enzyme S subunit
MAATKNTKAFYNTEIPEGWSVSLLGELGTFSKGKGILKEQVISDGLPCIRYGEIYTTHDFIIKKFKSFICDDVANESKEIKNGDILFAGSGETVEEIGKAVAYIGNDKAYAGGDVIILSTKKDVNPECLSYALETDFVKKQKRVLGQGNSVVHIYSSDLSKVKFPLPPLPEQKAIALVLSTADTAIHTTEKLIAQKALRKKWLMQQLLTGKKRLKGFCEEWKEKKLGKLFNQIKNVNDGDDTHSIMTISSKLGLISQEDKFDRVIAGDSLKKYTQLVKGDFAYNKGNSKTYPMGCIYRLEEKESALVPFVYICFSPSDLVDGLFYKHWFSAHGLDKQLNKIITSGARGDGLLNVNTDDFFGLKIIFPPKEEQTAIAQVLQAADKEISLLKAKAEKLREQKKGLMQVLLTGKIRLNYDSSDFYDSNENK